MGAEKWVRIIVFHLILITMPPAVTRAQQPGATTQIDATQPTQAIESAPSPFDGPASYDIRGFIRGEMHVPAFAGDDSPSSFGNPATYFVVTSEFTAEADFNDTLSGLVNLRYRIKDIGRVMNDERLIGDNADRNADLREGFLRYGGDLVDITAGQQIIFWGVTDGINPTDKLCPRDLTIVSSDRDDRRLGILALKGDLYLGDHTLTGVWQPFFTDSKLRLSGLPEEADITIQDAQLPARTLDNSTVALKWAAIFSRTDVSLSYFYGWDTLPDIILDQAVIDDEGTEVWVKPVFNRIENYGVDFASVIGPVILRGEGAYTHVKDRGTRSAGRRKSQIQWIVGPEWEWFENFTVNIQYGMTHVLDHEEIPSDESEIENDPQAGVDAFNARLHRQLRQHNPLATLRVDYQLFQETVFLQFRGLYWIEDEELRLSPRAVYDINDHLNITLGASLSFGPAGSRFHRSGENYNEVFAELKYSF